MSKPRSFRFSQGSSIALLAFTAVLGIAGAFGGPLRDQVGDLQVDQLKLACALAFAGLTASALAVANCAVSLASYLRGHEDRRLGFWCAVGSAVLCALVSKWGFELGIGFLLGRQGSPLDAMLVSAAGVGLVFVKAGMFFAIAEAQALNRAEIKAEEDADKEREDALARDRMAHSATLHAQRVEEPAEQRQALPAPRPRGRKPTKRRNTFARAGAAAAMLMASGATASADEIERPTPIEQPAQEGLTWEGYQQAKTECAAKGLGVGTRAVAEYLGVGRHIVRYVAEKGPPAG